MCNTTHHQRNAKLDGSFFCCLAAECKNVTSVLWDVLATCLFCYWQRWEPADGIHLDKWLFNDKIVMIAFDATPWDDASVVRAVAARAALVSLPSWEKVLQFDFPVRSCWRKSIVYNWRRPNQSGGLEQRNLLTLNWLLARKKKVAQVFHLDRPICVPSVVINRKRDWILICIQSLFRSSRLLFHSATERLGITREKLDWMSPRADTIEFLLGAILICSDFWFRSAILVFLASTIPVDASLVGGTGGGDFPWTDDHRRRRCGQCGPYWQMNASTKTEWFDI